MIIEINNRQTEVHFIPYISTTNTAIILFDVETQKMNSDISVNFTERLPRDIVILDESALNGEIINILIENKIIHVRPIAKYHTKGRNYYAHRLAKKAKLEQNHQYDLNDYPQLYLKY